MTRVDLLDVEHVLAGYRMNLTGPTLLAAIEALAGRGVPHWVIGERLGISERHVSRLRERAAS